MEVLSALEEKGLSNELEKILDIVSLSRDINNDFPNRNFEKEFKEIEDLALSLFKQILFNQENRGRINVVIIGNFSSGKSSLINCLFGKEVCPTKVNPTTSSITRFIYGEEKRVFLIEKNGSRKEILLEDYKNLSQHQLETMDKTKSYLFEYQYPCEILESIVLYDTPGFENPKNKLDEVLTKNLFLKKADVAIFVQDIAKPSLEERTLNRIKELQSLKPGIPWILVLNKADMVSEQDFERIKNYWNSQRTKDLFKEIIIYSAKEIMNYYKLTEKIKNIKDDIFNFSLKEKEALLLIEAANKSSPFKKKNKIKKLNLIVESNNKKLEFSIEMGNEKSKVLKENHDKFVESLRRLAIDKTKILDKKIYNLKSDLLKVIERNLFHIEKNLNLELFEPIESYKKIISNIKKSKKKHLELCTTGSFSESEFEFILRDAQLHIEEMFNKENLDYKILERAMEFLKEEKDLSTESLKRFYNYLLNALNRELDILLERANRQIDQVREKLILLDKITKELKSEWAEAESKEVVC